MGSRPFSKPVKTDTNFHETILDLRLKTRHDTRLTRKMGVLWNIGFYPEEMDSNFVAAAKPAMAAVSHIRLK